VGNSSEICGVVLAGGMGSRLLPLTTSLNKHLLPVYDEPMIYKSLATIQRLGISDVIVVLGGYSGNSFFKLLGDGHRFGLNIRYAYQEKPGGIAEALKLTEEFVSGRKLAVILGDNVFESSMKKYVDMFLDDKINECYLFLKEVPNPSDFGIAWIDDNGSITHMLEKPKNPDSNMAITGLYFYTSKVFDLINKSIDIIGYSDRGELEITDINRFFMNEGVTKGINFEGHWADCGTIDALLETSKLMNDWNSGAWMKVVKN